MEFRHKLKELRQQQDLTLRKLGEKAGVSYSIMNGIENGRIQPTADVVLAIAAALRIDDKDRDALLRLAGNTPSE